MSGGTTDKAKGKVKEAAGDLTGDRDLKNEGRVDRASGSVKDKVGDVTAFTDAVRRVLPNADITVQPLPRAQRSEFVGDLGDQTDARFSRRALAKAADRDWHVALPTVAAALRGAMYALDSAYDKVRSR